ncbi:MAG: PKD domain-containing protein [Anaerolineae bacterium]|nr:PKD domain-containing protein [Anaerolineae bacterium]
MWDDLDPGDTNDPVYYHSFSAGTCPYGGYAGACLAVQYQGYHHYQSGGGGALAGTWEAILLDNHSILLQYQDAGAEEGFEAAAAYDGSIVFEIDLIRTGTWWAPLSWGTVHTCTVPGLADNTGIDYDAEHSLLYHSDDASTNIVVTDLDRHVLDAFTCDSPAGLNTGVTYIEGRNEPEIWVTDYSSGSTTRCAASSTPACGRTVTLFSDDFEGGLGNWTFTRLWNQEQEADTCGALVAPFRSPDTGAYFGLDATCTFSTGLQVSGTLELEFDLDLADYSHATLKFWSYEQTECGGYCPWDHRYVDVSTDGGATWATAWVSTGPEATWHQASANLWDYSGGPLRVRFRFDSVDAIGNDYFGWLVDNVEIVACPVPVQLSFAVEAPNWCGPVANEAVIAGTEVATITVQATTHVVEDLYRLWDFEIDGGGFARDLAGEWQWGTPTYPPGLAAHSGDRVWGTDLHGDADDTVGHHRLSRPVSLPTHPNGIYLSWWDWYGAEVSDCTRVYVDATPVYERCDTDQRRWTHHVLDLSAWAGQTVNLEFDLEVCCDNPGPDGMTATTTVGQAATGLPAAGFQPDSAGVDRQDAVTEPIFPSVSRSIAPKAPEFVGRVLWDDTHDDDGDDLMGYWQRLGRADGRSARRGPDPIHGTVLPGECMNVQVTFDATGLSAGDYAAELVVWSNDPDSWAIPLPVTMTALEPVTIVDVTPTIDGLEATFDATATGAPPLTYAWSFGDGGASALEDPAHTYARNGCYTVELTASNACSLATWSGQVCIDYYKYRYLPLIFKSSP